MLICIVRQAPHRDKTSEWHRATRSHLLTYESALDKLTSAEMLLPSWLTIVV